MPSGYVYTVSNERGAGVELDEKNPRLLLRAEGLLISNKLIVKGAHLMTTETDKRVETIIDFNLFRVTSLATQQ